MTPTELQCDGHVVRLKWHRARRGPDDAPFTLARLVEGMLAGAAVEIDVRIDHGVPVIRHDAARWWRRTPPATPLAAVADALRSASGAPGRPDTGWDSGVDTGWDSWLPASAQLQLDIKDPAAVMTHEAASVIYLDHRIILGLAGGAGGHARHHGQRSHNIVADIHAAGRKVDTYTLTSPDSVTVRQVRALAALGVDQITTDDAEGFAAAFRQ